MFDKNRILFVAAHLNKHRDSLYADAYNTRITVGMLNEVDVNCRSAILSGVNVDDESRAAIVSIVDLFGKY